MVRNREWKMVVLFATALALTAAAAAACVLPWFYCKPPANDDEDREASKIHDNTDPGSHTRSVTEEKPTPGAKMHIHGISYVKVVFPPNSSTDHHSTTSTNTSSSALNENRVVDGVRHLIKAQNDKTGLQLLDDIDGMTSGVINAQNIRTHRNPERIMKSDYSVSAEPHPSRPELENSEISQPGSINTSNEGGRVLIKNEGNIVVNIRNNETSNLTEESSTESTNRDLSMTSELPNSDDIRMSDIPSESKNVLYLAASLIDPKSTQAFIEEKTSTTVRTSDSSNPTDESSTETTNKTSTSQDSENLSSGPTKVQTIAIVESVKVSNVLETIPEVSTSTTPSYEPGSKIPQQLHCSSQRINATSNLSVDQINSKPDRTPSFSPDSTSSAISKRRNHKNKLTSGYSWFKKMFRGRKTNNTPRTNRKKYDQSLHPESVTSLSAEKTLPTGQSTLNSDDIIECIRTRRSPKNLQCCTLHTVQDSGICNQSNCAIFGIEDVEEPLDLSIRSTPESIEENVVDMSVRRKSLSHSADACKEVFRGVVKYVNVRKSSKSSEEGVRDSDSLMFCDQVSKMAVKSANESFKSDSSNIGNVKVGDTESFIDDSEVGKLGNNCLTKSNRLKYGIKKIFQIGHKGNTSSVQKGQGLNRPSVEFQRNSAGTSLSCTDVSSYFELGIAKSDGEKNRVPCTEL